MIKEIIKYFFGKNGSEFNLLKAYLAKWGNEKGHFDFLRAKQSFQTVFAKYYAEYFKEYKLYCSKSMEHLVENNINYPDTSVFKKGGRYLEPDICVVRDNRIVEIVEINTTIGGKYSVIFSDSKDGGSHLNGSLIKLKNIKDRYPEINCYQLMIKKLNLRERDWGEDLLNDLIDNEYIRLEVVAIFNQKIRLELYSVTDKPLLINNFFKNIKVSEIPFSITYNN